MDEEGVTGGRKLMDVGEGGGPCVMVLRMDWSSSVNVSRVFLIPGWAPDFPNLEKVESCALATGFDDNLLTTATPPTTAASSMLMMGCTFTKIKRGFAQKRKHI